MGEERSRRVRAGIAALNIVAPGLGLMRIGQWRAGLVFLSLGPLTILLFYGYFALFGPTRTLPSFAALVGTVLALFIGSYAGAAILSYRRSRFKTGELAWWSRWYGLVAICVALLAVTAVLPEPNRLQRNFYIPSESMVPFLRVNDRLVADMRPPGRLMRGDVVLYQSQSGFRIGRIAAIGGDRIALKSGVVMLNGTPVPQRLRSDFRVASPETRQPMQVLEERFPGELRPHLITDDGPRIFDDFAEQRVRQGHVFILGDNRDFSADSRVPVAAMGVEQLPVTQIMGEPLFIYWSDDASRRGMRLLD